MSVINLNQYIIHFNIHSPSSINPSLCLSFCPLCLIPLSVLPVLISHKYSADLMLDYHWINLIEPKRMFHLGIAHNNINTVWNIPNRTFKDEIVTVKLSILDAKIFLSAPTRTWTAVRIFLTQSLTWQQGSIL